MVALPVSAITGLQAYRLDMFPLLYATGEGGGKGGRCTYCARMHTDERSLIIFEQLRSKKIKESSEDVFNCRNCSKARPHVSRDCGLSFRFALTCLHSAVYIESFFYYNGVTTIEGTGF